MRSHLRIVCAILLAGLSSGSSTTPGPIQTPINAGERLIVEVLTFFDSITKCYLESESGQRIEFKPSDESDERFQIKPDTELSHCRASILVNDNDNGLWTLTAENEEGRQRVQSYNLTVNFNPDSTDHKQIEYLDERVFIETYKGIGSRHTLTIPSYEFGESEICQVIQPNGKTFDVKLLDGLDDDDDDDDDEFNFGDENDEFIWRGPVNSCSVIVKVISPRVIGQWMLISVGTKYSDRIERRLPFTIRIEQATNTTEVSAIDVREGNDFFIRLKRFINVPDVSTCELRNPDGLVPANYTDLRLENNCGYLVHNVTKNYEGKWELLYSLGDSIIYRAFSFVTVHGNPEVNEEKETLYWTEHRPVNVSLGPDNAIYCRIKGPDDNVVYNGFGRCSIKLDRAIKSQHEGNWMINFGLPGQVVTEEKVIRVVVEEADPQPTVSTQVDVNHADKIATLSCSLASPDPVNSCKFRDPYGRILIAAEAVAESRYSWHGTGTNFTAGVHAHDCGLRITNFTLRDTGIWRCAIDTEGETYYGFFTVSPPPQRDPEIAAQYIRKPILTAGRSSVSGVSGESVTMTCAVDASIRYCYFRARNGTVFNVSPSDAHDFASYVGAGLDAGECGVRFPSLATSDSGVWSCHVGLIDPQTDEQRARFDVTIKDAMAVTTEMNRVSDVLSFKAVVHGERPLEYCRFVRIDGLGFIEANLPLSNVSNIENWSDLSRGVCAIRIFNPSSLEQHPWVIVAKVRGQDEEISRLTDIALSIPVPPGGGGTVQFRIPGAWIIVMSIGMCMILLASFIGPKRNREWTYARASAIRNSFMTKKVEQSAR